jgi:hypothetical protein
MAGAVRSGGTLLPWCLNSRGDVIVRVFLIMDPISTIQAESPEILPLIALPVNFDWKTPILGWIAIDVASSVLYSWGVPVPRPLHPTHQNEPDRSHRAEHVDKRIWNNSLANLQWQIPPYGLGRTRTSYWWNTRHGNPQNTRSRRYILTCEDGSSPFDAWGERAAIYAIFPRDNVGPALQSRRFHQWSPLIMSLQDGASLDIQGQPDPVSHVARVYRITRVVYTVVDLPLERWKRFDSDSTGATRYISNMWRAMLRKSNGDRVLMPQKTLPFRSGRYIVYHSDNAILPLEAPLSIIYPAGPTVEVRWLPPTQALINQKIRNLQVPKKAFAPRHLHVEGLFVAYWGTNPPPPPPLNQQPVRLLLNGRGQYDPSPWYVGRCIPVAPPPDAVPPVILANVYPGVSFEEYQRFRTFKRIQSQIRSLARQRKQILG